MLSFVPDQRGYRLVAASCPYRYEIVFVMTSELETQNETVR